MVSQCIITCCSLQETAAAAAAVNPRQIFCIEKVLL